MRFTLTIIPKTRGNIHQNMLHFFTKLYYNHTCKKNLPFKNFFYINPLFNYLYSPRKSRQLPWRGFLFTKKEFVQRTYYIKKQHCKTSSHAILLYFCTFFKQKKTSASLPAPARLPDFGLYCSSFDRKAFHITVHKCIETCNSFRFRIQCTAFLICKYFIVQECFQSFAFFFVYKI